MTDKKSRFRLDEEEDSVIAGAINSPEKIESDEINRLKKELEAQKILNERLNTSHMVIAPTRLPDRTTAIDYPLKVFPDVMDYIDRNTRGSKNIVFNYLISEGIKAVKEALENGEIVLSSEAIPKTE